MNNLGRAADILNAGDYTCVLCNGGTVYTSKKRGVIPIVEWINSGIDLNGFSAADKIVGKAAALLFVLAGVSEVYAPVMSSEAIKTLSKHGVNAVCESTTGMVVNRAGTGSCPMEQAVHGIEKPEEALRAVVETLKVLNANL